MIKVEEKRRVGRPATGRRKNYLSMPLHDAEKEALNAAAKEAGKSVSGYLRDTILETINFKKP